MSAPEIVPRFHTTPGRDAWLRTRREALRAALARRYPADVAARVSLDMLAQLYRETGAGRAEWNFNAGNIKCSGVPDPPHLPGWHNQCHDLARFRYRSYGTLVDGIADYVDLLHASRYKPALRGLIERPASIESSVRWYAETERAGYNPWSAQSEREYRSIRILLARFVW